MMWDCVIRSAEDRKNILAVYTSWVRTSEEHQADLNPVTAISYIIKKFEKANRAEYRYRNNLCRIPGEYRYQDLLDSLGAMKVEWKEAMKVDNPLKLTGRDGTQRDPWGVVLTQTNHTPQSRLPLRM